MKVRVCATKGCREVEMIPWEVTWLRVDGDVVFVTEPGLRVLGGEMWGYHVWGSEAYSVARAKGRVPFVLVDEGPTSVVRKGRWLAMGFRAEAPEPWGPVSALVKGVRTPVRYGILVAVP